ISAIALGVPVVAGAWFIIDAGYRYLEGRRLTTSNFDDISVPAKDEYIAAAAGLRHFGISITQVLPGEAAPIITSAAALYNGQAVDTTLGRHCLTQKQTKVPTAPVSFTQRFGRPVRAVKAPAGRIVSDTRVVSDYP